MPPLSDAATSYPGLIPFPSNERAIVASDGFFFNLSASGEKITRTCPNFARFFATWKLVAVACQSDAKLRIRWYRISAYAAPVRNKFDRNGTVAHNFAISPEYSISDRAI